MSEEVTTPEEAQKPLTAKQQAALEKARQDRQGQEVAALKEQGAANVIVLPNGAIRADW